SSPGSLEITGISATSGCPGLDSTRMLPRPRASAALLYSPSARTSTPCIERIALLPRGFMPANIPAEPDSEYRGGETRQRDTPALRAGAPPSAPQTVGSVFRLPRTRQRCALSPHGLLRKPRAPSLACH